MAGALDLRRSRLHSPQRSGTCSKSTSLQNHATIAALALSAIPFMQQQISDRDQIIVDLRNQNDELVAALQKTQSSAMSKLFQAQLEIARARSGAQEAALQQVLTITNNLQTSGASVRSNTSAQVFASLHQMQPQATAPGCTPRRQPPGHRHQAPGFKPGPQATGTRH